MNHRCSANNMKRNVATNKRSPCVSTSKLLNLDITYVDWRRHYSANSLTFRKAGTVAGNETSVDTIGEYPFGRVRSR